MWPQERGSQLMADEAPKTYLYVSDSKVDMLTDGLGESFASRFEVKGRVGVPGVAGLEAATREQKRGRFARAARLCAELDSRREIGSVDSEARFFRAQLIMSWGFWNRANGRYADVVFFTGFMSPNTFVGIGGSAYHTMERDGDRLQHFSNSGLQQMMQFLRERSGNIDAAQTRPPGAWDAEGWDADHDNAMVPERVEFVAERLLDKDDPNSETRTIIGSPIYVARSSRRPTRRESQEYEVLRHEAMVRLYGRPRQEPYHPGSRWQIGKHSDPILPPARDPSSQEPEPA